MPTWEEGEEGGKMVLSMGPQHPSTHGVLRLELEMEGERVLKITPDVGYLHTGIEKTFETLRYDQGTALTPRIDYLSPMNNTWCFIMAVEKLLEITPPPRAEYVRVILGELTRINSHLVWLATHALDIGAMSVFLYCFREREMILDIYEMVSGARMMDSYYRAGGLAWDIPPGFIEAVQAILDILPARIDEYESLLTRNPIWMERTQNVGAISAEKALALSATGPALRATGVPWDLRKTMPYSVYEAFDFEIPVGSRGDVYDRYLVRMEEMRQSLRIIEQGIRVIPRGPFRIDNHKIAPPPKEEIYLSMEALIHHFKLWTEGFRVPPGEAYAAIESPRGELGFYVVSDGSAKPCRVHVRGPSFINLQLIGPMSEGGLVADLVAVIASLDPVLGEVDR
ncbi:MAG: NADH-quinone oxidoreductase subunit D [Ardenticatenales bacterium]|nr:NADH-quinone oxidoreductase subunit D [Ardenticatenales bacterium]